MPTKKKSPGKKKLTVMEKVDMAQTGKEPPKRVPVKPKPAKKNPYPKGSARAKLWARREADKRKK